MSGSVNCSFINQSAWHQAETPSVHPGPNTIYIWQASITTLHSFYNSCNALLNDAERSKAFRYYQQTDQQRYVLQHGLLRLLLGWYLNTPAADVAFSFNPNKKPYLANSSKACYFNISHSGPEMLIAIGDKELGVDIERINYDFKFQDITSQYFSAVEAAFINPAPDPTSAFFLLWTRKEALLKACGAGIDDNLPQMPALDGLHKLSPAYADTAWLTTSFKANNNCMASITYPAPQANVSLQQVNADWVALLLKANI
jgi:4'-phosphopantetheinyl transferase